MAELDEMSRAIGELEGTIKAMHDEQLKQGKQIDRIFGKITTLRIKMGSVSAIVSLVMTLLVLLLRPYIFK